MGALLAAALAASALGGDAQSPLPPCDPAHNGELVRPQLADSEQRVGSKVLFATHRIRAKLYADSRVQEPYGVEYDTQPGSEQLAPGPGVVGRLSFLSDTPGPVSIPATWIVTKRDDFGDPPDPYCMGSGSIPATLRAPARTSLAVRNLIPNQPGEGPRLKILIAGRPNDDLRPVTVRMRRGTRGRARELFTVQLANVRPHAGGYRFRQRAAGVTVQSSATQLYIEGRGLVTLGVSMPRARKGRTVRRNFTIEVVRDGRALVRVHAAISCYGQNIGLPRPAQSCTERAWHVSRPG